MSYIRWRHNNVSSRNRSVLDGNLWLGSARTIFMKFCRMLAKQKKTALSKLECNRNSNGHNRLSWVYMLSFHFLLKRNYSIFYNVQSVYYNFWDSIAGMGIKWSWQPISRGNASFLPPRVVAPAAAEVGASSATGPYHVTKQKSIDNHALWDDVETYWYNVALKVG